MEFNLKAFDKMGLAHWEIMKKFMKTEKFIRKSALRNSSNLQYCTPEIVKKLLPELIEDKKFKVTPLDLLKAGAQANNPSKEDLLKSTETFLRCLKSYEINYKLAPGQRKNFKLKVPMPLQKKLLAYSII